MKCDGCPAQGTESALGELSTGVLHRGQSHLIRCSPSSSPGSLNYPWGEGIFYDIFRSFSQGSRKARELKSNNVKLYYFFDYNNWKSPHCSSKVEELGCTLIWPGTVDCALTRAQILHPLQED